MSINKLCEYNESYLYINENNNRVSFEGNLDDVAIAIYKKYGEILIKKNINSCKICHGLRLINHFIEFDCSNFLIEDIIPAKPIFLDLLNKKYNIVFNKYENMKIFW